MAAVRIAAVLALALHLAGAQQSSSGFTGTVIVTDPTGAPVPGAQVDIGDGCSDPIGGETNEQGMINFDLSPGANYHLTATFPGFCPAWKAIDLLNQPTQTIPVKLEAGGCPSACTPVCAAVTSAPPGQPRQGRLEPGQARLAVQVTDVRGGALPDARVETDPSSDPPGPVLNADSNGRASLKLPAGTHTFSIASPGFERWSRQIDLQGASSRTIAVALQPIQVGSNCNPAVITARTAPDMPLSVPEAVLISAEPLQNLDPLPSRPAKKHW